MKELKEALVVWLTREKPQPSQAQMIMETIVAVCLTIVLVATLQWAVLFTVCR